MIALLCCCAASAVLAGPPQSYRLHRSEAEEKIRAALFTTTPASFDFVEAPLSDVVAFLEDYFKIQIELDTKSMEDAGVAAETQITRSLPNVSLASALDLLLHGIDLDYLIKNDVLLITTTQVAQETTELRIYDVRDIPHDQEGSKALGAMIEKMFAECSHHALTVAPMGDALVIRNTQRGHDEIEALLNTLRMALDGQPQPPPDQPGPAKSSGESQSRVERQGTARSLSVDQAVAAPDPFASPANK